MLVACGRPASTPYVGGLSPQVAVLDMDGREIALGAASGRVQLLSFWASWCGPCRREGPALATLIERHRGDVDLTRINLGEDDDTLRAAALALPMPGLDVVDVSGAAAAAYAVDTLPLTLLVGPDGVVLFRDQHIPTEADLEGAFQ